MKRAKAMVTQMDKEDFGGCTNIGECQSACPKKISIDFIARLNRDYLGASLRAAFQPEAASTDGGGA